MGFNTEQYELNYNESWNNITGNDALRGAGTICVKGKPIYLPPIYAGLQLTKKGRTKISENRQICQARQDSKVSKGSEAPSEPETTTKSMVSSGEPAVLTDTAPKSNTGMYIGIGVSVLVLGIIGFLIIRKK
jgi:hypothetical protein